MKVKRNCQRWGGTVTVGGDGKLKKEDLEREISTPHQGTMDLLTFLFFSLLLCFLLI